MGEEDFKKYCEDNKVQRYLFLYLYFKLNKLSVMSKKLSEKIKSICLIYITKIEF